MSLILLVQWDLRNNMKLEKETIRVYKNRLKISGSLGTMVCRVCHRLMICLFIYDFTFMGVAWTDICC